VVLENNATIDSFLKGQVKQIVSSKNSNRKKEQSKKKIAAVELSKNQKAISVAEFFEKNRHLLGFDNNRKALLTTIKEAMDNSLDACEEAHILPEIYVEIIDMGNNRYKVIVEDNGPGIVKQNIPFVFGKLLYGSKFHRLKQSRGQQGIGISAAVLYSQLTTGRATKVISRIDKNKPAHAYEIRINTLNNEPEILKEEIVEWDKEYGTRIELDLIGSYYRGAQSVDEYIKQTSIVNPHATIIYVTPDGDQRIYARVTETSPKEPKEIKPHPYGLEIGTLIKMLKLTKEKTILSFLKKEFSRVSQKVATEILEKASIQPREKPTEIDRTKAERIIEAISKTKILPPPLDCLSEIGKELIRKGLMKEVNAEFYETVTRKPVVYKGYPFIIEAGIAYGGELPRDSPATVMRFANKIPLLYQAGSCAFTKTVIALDWKKYGLNQPKGALPLGPLVILIHIASVWVPYTNEAKEAIANYPEIIKEVKLALQEVGRKLGKYLSKKKNVESELKKRSFIEKYIPHISFAIKDILNLDESIESELELKLKEVLKKTRGKIEKVGFDKESNTEFEEEFKLKVNSHGIVDEIYLDEEEQNGSKE